MYVQVRNGTELDGCHDFAGVCWLLQRYVVVSDVLQQFNFLDADCCITGTAPVSRSCVGEFANQVGLNKAKAMGIFGFCFSLGSIIGPLIGGYLSKV